MRKVELMGTWTALLLVMACSTRRVAPVVVGPFDLQLQQVIHVRAPKMDVQFLGVLVAKENYRELQAFGPFLNPLFSIYDVAGEITLEVKEKRLKKHSEKIRGYYLKFRNDFDPKLYRAKNGECRNPPSNEVKEIRVEKFEMDCFPKQMEIFLKKENVRIHVENTKKSS